MFRKHKKLFTILGSILAMLVPLVARAVWWQGAFKWAMHTITAAAVWLIGIFMTLGASLTDFMFRINRNYLSAEYLTGNDESNLIKIGWRITRDLANLGFVLAIIIIAFATIIQYKQYGAKKLLPRLIAAALIVNFSMAIAAPVIGFSNTVTDFFLGGARSGKLATVIAGAFNPQKLIVEPEEGPPIPPGLEEGGTSGGFGTVFLVSVASAILAVIFTAIAAITFFAFAFMLMIRYIILSFLLVLAPIAWLAWVIPGLEDQFKNWWSSFFKWCFFAPAMSFFIYLALTAARQMEGPGEIAGSNFAVAALRNLVIHGSQMTILAGLMLGGLIAAEKLGIHGAKGAIGIANKVGNWGLKGVLKKAKGGALRAGSFAFREKEGKGTLAERFRNYAQTTKPRLWRMTAGLAARGLTKIESLGTETLAKEHDKVVSGWSDNKLLAALPSAAGPRKIAVMKELAKRKKLHEAGVSSLVTQGTKNLFARFGQGGKWADIEKAAGISVEMNIALRENNEKQLRESTDKFIRGLSRGNIKNMPWDSIFKALSKKEGALGLTNEKLNILAESLSKSLVVENAALVPNIIPKMDAEALGAFKVKYENALKKERDRAAEAGDIKLLDKVADAQKSYNKVIANYVIGFYGPEEGKTATEGSAPRGGG